MFKTNVWSLVYFVNAFYSTSLNLSPKQYLKTNTYIRKCLPQKKRYMAGYAVERAGKIGACILILKLSWNQGIGGGF